MAEYPKAIVGNTCVSGRQGGVDFSSEAEGCFCYALEHSTPNPSVGT